MANPEHVKIAKQGADAIAAWRREHPEERLDLSRADLSQADLCEADLSGADLCQTNLRGAKLIGANLHDTDLSRSVIVDANLSDANLSDANLCDANLSGADLCRANLFAAKLISANLDGAYLGGAVFVDANLSDAHLRRADLFDTNLTRANLTGADLTDSGLARSILRNADLRGADLTNAYLLQVAFANLDLGTVRGLESLRHLGPSTIGVDTLFRSKGMIPTAFLRGCGVPEELIMQLPEMIAAMEPMEFYSCFLSHSSADDAFARQLHGRFDAEKVRVYFAPEDMRGGKKVGVQIDEAIRTYDRLLLVLSEKSMASEWVRREIKRAREKERGENRNVLFPIALVPYDAIRAWECLDSDTGEDLAERVREYHIPDFSKWKQEDDFEKAFAKLMDDLRAEKPRKVKTSKRRNEG